MRGRRAVGRVMTLWLLAWGCSSPATPTHPSQTQEIHAGASGSGSSG
jgi:hypothetical protein